ncbi:MAG: phosphotriesterase family protein [Anaerolineae bacterium]
MSVMTVLGPVEVSTLGITLPHEHLFIDLRNQYTESPDFEKSRLGREQLSLANVGVLRRNPYALRDNLLLNDLNLANTELEMFKNLGGQSIVDCTSLGIARDALGLKMLAKSSGVKIIAGCGYYTHDTHPLELVNWSIEQLAHRMLIELTLGMENSTIRAGVIGEIGTSWPIHPDELKCLRAAASAQCQTGVALYVHCYPWGKGGVQAAQLLLDEGVPPGKIVICHSDVELDHNYILQLLALGVYVEFDNFGKEYYIDPPDRGFAGGIFARDLDRVRMLKQIITAGYVRQLLITNDICLKSLLHAYGGWGYDHILAHIVPMLREVHITEESINALLIGNPARLLNVSTAVIATT